MAKTDLTAQLARELFRYEPDTGRFFCQRTGRATGHHRPSGYIAVSVGGVKFLAHRVAWLITHGTWPTNVIDHIDGNGSNNRLANLRDVPQQANTQNRTVAHRTSVSGVLGVSTYGDRGWRARIKVNGIGIYLGCFKTKEEAHAAYLSAKKTLHVGFHHGPPM